MAHVLLHLCCCRAGHAKSTRNPLVLFGRHCEGGDLDYQTTPEGASKGCVAELLAAKGDASHVSRRVPQGSPGRCHSGCHASNAPAKALDLAGCHTACGGNTRCELCSLWC